MHSQLGGFDSLKVAFIPSTDITSNKAVLSFLEKHKREHLSTTEANIFQSMCFSHPQVLNLANVIFKSETNKKKCNWRDTLALSNDQLEILKTAFDDAQIMMLVTNLNYRSVLKQNGNGKTTIKYRIQLYSLEYKIVISYLEGAVKVPYIVPEDDHEKTYSLVLNEYERYYQSCISSWLRP